MIGNDIYALAKKLWPLNRSITGQGVRETLNIIKSEYLEDLEIVEVPTGAKAFDWRVPLEWKVNSAYIIRPDGEKICDFDTCNLHLVGYSVPFRSKMPLKDLLPHLHSLPSQPNAIPYITSYYDQYWGFCISEDEKRDLPDGEYEVHIDTELFEGFLTYGELCIPGETEKEIFISTYVCHPSMANNELSGPCVATFLAKTILQKSRRKYSYRFIFVPETIGSICYLSKHIKHLQEKVIAGFNVTCVGDDRAYSYLPTRFGNTLSDQVAQHTLKWIDPNYSRYSWDDRGSDERQYCSPNVNLPVASIMRSKYGSYPEYHTSLDALGTVVTPEGLLGGFESLRIALEAIENNIYPRATFACEPFMSKRGIYPTISTKIKNEKTRLLMNVLTWADGSHSLIEIADFCKTPVWELYPIVEVLHKHNLIEVRDEVSNVY
ncbi:DUF4910 domain-containing protein [Polynucleobacter sp. es-GGE-1]|uniref:DUF4910 domain-containing protein n=1 Tax=Polynucleobacter sp. es-GGE-1 TaxID=1819724 RepID=UPI001C0DE14E|nr:DUF4910 domain-containing protein [Polynucleobacter sp. es-GGE-1]MBU3635536.1 DUF4910 domain-containing protein [Polynucleobacter sp. es-GGE-1]